MNPRTILLLLPYAMLVGGVLAAAKVGTVPGGAVAAIQALSVAAVGLLWIALRTRRSSRR